MYPPGTSRRTRNSPDSTGSFGAFVDQWLIRHERFHAELRQAVDNLETTSEHELMDLTDSVLSHYQQYFDEKSMIMHGNVSAVLSPPWLTSLERAYLWVGGFKPGLIVKLAMSSPGLELTEEQTWRLELLRSRTRARERDMNNEMARLQESVADSPILEATRRCGRMPLRDGLVDEERGAMDDLMAKIEAASTDADVLRMRTAAGVIEMLNVGQRVKFLADAVELQLKLRSSGLWRDAEENGGS